MVQYIVFKRLPLNSKEQFQIIEDIKNKTLEFNDWKAVLLFRLR